MGRRNNDSFWIWGLVTGALVLGGVIAIYVGMRDEPVAEVGQTPVAAMSNAAPARNGPVAAPGAAAAPTTPSVTVPPPRALPLPTLDDSDAEVRSSLNEVVGERATSEFLLPERIVRNIVVTIDNLMREEAAIEQRPVKPAPGTFVVGGSEDAPVIAPTNYDRYTTLVGIVERTDARTLVSMYRGLQPLFQQAYEELGHPDDTFNARLLETIEHLLATPEVQGPIALTQPSLLYEYANKDIEKLSVGQKLLIRIGPRNRAVIKAKLREIRAELV